uniref:Large ribosomal subunit protein uL13c n=1 Tax=Pterocladia lucida TaxID=31408 RepID=A0A6M3WW71_PTELU|nr:ribosomal protein L13 [Pterocladia lucida]
MNKTFVTCIKKHNTKWYIVDANRQTLGRLSTNIATILRGKNQITYMPHLNNNSYIIVINAKDIIVTGKKKYQKQYKKHSGKPGGLKVERFIDLQNRIPERIIEKSVKGMLPKNTLGKQLFNKLKVYPGNNHPHEAQKPELISFKFQ